jgi:hypothetical protein
MAYAAVLVRRNVAVIFTSGIHTIVTGRAVIHDTGMIKGTAGKTGGTMAYAAIFSSGRMIRCLSWHNAI